MNLAIVFLQVVLWSILLAIPSSSDPMTLCLAIWSSDPPRWPFFDALVGHVGHSTKLLQADFLVPALERYHESNQISWAHLVTSVEYPLCLLWVYVPGHLFRHCQPFKVILLLTKVTLIICSSRKCAAYGRLIRRRWARNLSFSFISVLATGGLDNKCEVRWQRGENGYKQMSRQKKRDREKRTDKKKWTVSKKVVEMEWWREENG